MAIAVALDKPYETIRFLIHALGDPKQLKIDPLSLTPESPSTVVVSSSETFDLLTGIGGENLINLIPVDLRQELAAGDVVLEGSDEIGRLTYLMGRSLAALAALAVTNYRNVMGEITGISEFIFGIQQLSYSISKLEERIYSFTNNDRSDIVTVDIQRTGLLVDTAAGTISKSRSFPDSIEETDILEMIFFALFFTSVGYVLSRGNAYEGGVKEFLSDSADSTKQQKVIDFMSANSSDGGTTSDGRFIIIAIALSAINEYIYHFSGYRIEDDYTKSISALAKAIVENDKENGGIPIEMKDQGFLDLNFNQDSFSLKSIIDGSQKVLFNQNPVQIVRFINRFDIPEDYAPQNPFFALFNIDNWATEESKALRIEYLEMIKTFLKDLSFTGIGNVADSYQFYRLCAIDAVLLSIIRDPGFKDVEDKLKDVAYSCYYLVESYLYALYTRWFMSGNIYKIQYSRKSLKQADAISVYSYTKAEIDYTIVLLSQLYQRIEFKLNPGADPDELALIKTQKLVLGDADRSSFYTLSIGNYTANRLLDQIGVDSPDVNTLSDPFISAWFGKKVPLVLSPIIGTKDALTAFVNKNMMGLSDQATTDKLSKLISGVPNEKFTGRSVSDQLIGKIRTCAETFDENSFVTYFSALVLSPILTDLDSVSISDRIPADIFKAQTVAFNAERFNAVQETVRKTVNSFIF